MGIKQLMRLIQEKAPGAVRETELKNLFGRRVAMDASMALYSFMVAIRPDANFTLADESGEATSHLNGIFYRTIRMMKHGLKPIWVFDGKPPTMKGGELAKRKKAKKAATEKLEEAAEVGDQVEMAKAVKATVRVLPKHNEEAKKLLRLMGVPVVEAPTEAEAQCAELVRKGKAWATGTEDMDALTFGCPILLRYLTYSEARKQPVLEVTLSKVLEGLELTTEQFTDLCILMGCDYIDTLPKIGKGRAYDLIKQYGSIEGILQNLNKEKYPVPEDWNYEGARQLFKEPDVTPADDVAVAFTEPDVEGIVQFLCTEKGFNEERVRGSITKMQAAKTSSVQNRLTSYFGAPVKKPGADKPAAGKGAKAGKGDGKAAGKKQARDGDGDSGGAAKKAKAKKAFTGK